MHRRPGRAFIRNDDAIRTGSVGAVSRIAALTTGAAGMVLTAISNA